MLVCCGVVGDIGSGAFGDVVVDGVVGGGGGGVDVVGDDVAFGVGVDNGGVCVVVVVVDVVVMVIVAGACVADCVVCDVDGDSVIYVDDVGGFVGDIVVVVVAGVVDEGIAGAIDIVVGFVDVRCWYWCWC